MTWQLAAFGLLALALLGGVAWYERTKPPAKVVALVATLGALAALGRIAFAPLPNVKPTTDIVIITGAALGGAPAFVVGAVAALASNLFFGQGYWTPWQMLGWGLCGLLGALLGRIAGRRGLNRWSLAGAGVFAGFAFGEIMNFSTWVSFSDHSFRAFLAMATSAFPFDVAHAAGNAVFALAFGPALLRAIARFRERFAVSWRPAAAVAPLLLVALVLVAAPAQASAATSVSYLQNAQNGDGGWGAAPGQGSSQLLTGWVALGLAAAGRNPADVRKGSTSAIDYIRRGAKGIADVGELERTILVVGAAGQDPTKFGGRNLVARVLGYRRSDGSINGQVVYSSFGVLALRAAGRGPGDGAVKGATAWIAKQQNPDGGYNVFRRGGTSGIDETGAALQALAAGGRRGSSTVKRAAAFLVKKQNADGGFPLQPGGPSNAQSTAYAAQGLLAAGRDLAKVRKGGRDPLGYLRSLTADNGAVGYSRLSVQTPVWVTAQALLALAREPLPIAPVRRGGGGGGGGGGGAAAAGAGSSGGGAVEGGAGPGSRTPSTKRGGGGAAAPAPGGLDPAEQTRIRWVLGAHEAGLAAGVLWTLVAG